MKNLKVIAVCLILAQILYKYINNFSLYTSIFESITDPNEQVLLNFSENFLWLLMDLLTMVCGLFVLALQNDRAYRLLRFVYLMGAVFYLPQLAYYLVMGWSYGNFLGSFSQMIEFIGYQGVWLFCSIVFIKAKPEQAVARINLSDYELVSYTSTGHRLLHYLLDMLFLLPMVILWRSVLPGLHKSMLGMELLVIVAYFLYCFLAEAFFRQTFGKLVTRSCIVSNGVPLSTGRIFLRTLSRLIPFDKVSFLFGGNWHDRVSSTSVVYVDSWQTAFEDEKA